MTLTCMLPDKPGFPRRRVHRQAGNCYSGDRRRCSKDPIPIPTIQYHELVIPWQAPPLEAVLCDGSALQQLTSMALSCRAVPPNQTACGTSVSSAGSRKPFIVRHRLIRLVTQRPETLDAESLWGKRGTILEEATSYKPVPARTASAQADRLFTYPPCSLVIYSYGVAFARV